jgi:hypothetical protein
MIMKWWVRKDLEGGVSDLFRLEGLRLLKEPTNGPSWNQAPHKYECASLPLHQTAQSIVLDR